MKWNKRFILCNLFGLGVIALFTQCAGTTKNTSPPQWESPPPIVAAGVDSAVAREADSLARQLFVSWQRQEAAQRLTQKGETSVAKNDSLWNLLSVSEDSSGTGTTDSLRAIRVFNRGAEQLLAMRDIQNSPTLSPGEIRKRVEVHLDSARYYFETALRLNPFDGNTRLWLARVYQMQAKRLLQKEQLSRAAQTLEKLVRMDQSQHGLYARLGQIYLSLKQWDRAYRNFRAAEETLRKSAIFKVPEHLPLTESSIAEQLDSTRLFLYVYYQGETNIHRYQAPQALSDFRRALPLARNDEDRRIVQEAIDWINWDNGNIHAVEFRDSMLTLIDSQRYEEAAKGFRALKKLLSTEKAKREIDWRLSLLEYSHLGRPGPALSRMQQIVYLFLTDSAVTTPADTMYRQYFDSYGTMCHNEGLKALKKRKLRKALAYFRQSCSVPWKQRAKSYVEIARLSLNNPGHAVEAAEAALKERNRLTPEERISVMRILIESLKRLGRFEEAIRYFKEYREYLTVVRKHD